MKPVSAPNQHDTVCIITRKIRAGAIETLARFSFDWNSPSARTSVENMIQAALSNGHSVKLYRPAIKRGR